jgi:predicted dehydrogenase
VTIVGMTNSTSLRWGILATGGIARLMTRDLLAHDHRVEAVGSRSAASARAFAAEFGLPRAHASYEALAADPGVDIVYVATPHSHHAANALQAVAHGKHVLVEKAFTMNAGQAEQVVAAARDRGVVVLEAMWTRFLPHMTLLRRWLHDGRIGEVRAVHAEHCQRLDRDDDHRLYSPALAGGALLDLGVYPVSFAHDVLGTPTEVMASATVTPTGVDASVATLLTHTGGAVSTSFSSLRLAGPNRASVQGTDGRIDIAGTWYTPTTVTLLDATGAVVDEQLPPTSGRGMQYQAAELERLVAAGGAESAVMPPDESVAVMRTLDAVRERIGLRYPGE